MKDNLDSILESIDEFAKRAGISRSRALAAWYAINFYDLDEDEALEAAEADGGNDQGIDLIFADTTSQKTIVIQAYCPENLDKTTPKNKSDAVIACLPYLNDPKKLLLEGRPDIAETLESIKEINPDYDFSIGLISLGLANKSIERSFAAQNDMHKDKKFEFFYLAQEQLIEKYTSLIDAEGGVTEDELNFDSGFYVDKGDFGSAWVGSVSSKELIRLYTAHKNRLFAGNVRLFLGERKGGINEQIIKTAQQKPGHFWALNNGITIVADSVKDDKNNKKKLKLTRFSIVNGCQTTSCLFHSNATGAKVLTRVIAAKAGLKNEIIRYNNSQNAVKIWAVRAADNLQEQLRKEFKSFDIEYAPKQEGNRAKKKLSIIELDKVSQFLASREAQYLIQAINNKAELFDTPYKKIFPHDIKAKTVYLAWLVGNLSDAKRQDRLKSLKEDSPDDTNIGLLGIAGAFWIVYCTYKLISAFSNSDSSEVKVEKMKRQEFQNALTKYVDAALDIFYDSAIDSYDQKEYGSFKSTLRSTKFLEKLDSKINNKIVRLKKESNKLPALQNVAKSIKV